MRRRLLPLLLAPLLIAALFAVSGGRVGSEDPSTRYLIDGKPLAEIGTPVGTPFAVDATRLEECPAGKSGTRCREQAFGNLAAGSGPETALARLRAGLADGSFSLADCHMITHRIGSGALIHFGGDFAPVIERAVSDCSEGYLHGAFEPLFEQIDPGDTGAFARRMTELCMVERFGIERKIAANCAHGAAHAVVLRSGYNLPLAIDACAGAWGAPQTPQLHVSCLQGAFMENFIPSYSVRSPWLKTDDLLFPCPTFSDPLVAAACFVQVGDRLALTPGLSLESFAAVCSGAPARWSDSCFQGLGRTISFRSLGNGGPDPLEACSVARRYGQEDICLWQYAMSTIDGLRGSGVLPISGRSASVCERVADADARRGCWQGVGYALTDNEGDSIVLDEDVALALCRAEEIALPADLASCVSGVLGESPHQETGG